MFFGNLKKNIKYVFSNIARKLNFDYSLPVLLEI